MKTSVRITGIVVEMQTRIQLRSITTLNNLLTPRFMDTATMEKMTSLHSAWDREYRKLWQQYCVIGVA
jgi:hypothetical protein